MSTPQHPATHCVGGLVEHGKIVVRLRERTTSVRVTRLDGDGVPVPHTDVTITWSPTQAPTVRIPGRPGRLGPVATAAHLELSCTQAHHVQDTIEGLLSCAWDRFGVATTATAGDNAWLAVRDADDQMRATAADTLAEDLRDWCTPAQAPDLAHLQAETAAGRPAILTQRCLGILLVPIHSGTRHAQVPAAGGAA